MVNLAVIFVGLFAIIPNKDPQDPATVLLLDVSRGAVASDGELVPRHCARVYFVPKGSPADEVAVWGFEGEDLQIGAVGENPPKVPEQFVQLKNIVDINEAPNVKILPGCMGRNPALDCRKAGRPMLAGRVKMLGGHLRHLNVKDTSARLGEITLDSRINPLLGFRSLRSPSVKSAHVKAAPNGLLFVREVVDDFALDLGGERIVLGAAPPLKCAELGVPSPCSIVTVLNVKTNQECDDFTDDISISEDDSENERTVGGGVRANIVKDALGIKRSAGVGAHLNDASDGIDEGETGMGKEALSSHDKLDRHFELLYRLLLPSYLGELYVPYRRMTMRGQVPDPPENRCIPPVIEP